MTPADRAALVAQARVMSDNCNTALIRPPLLTLVSRLADALEESELVRAAHERFVDAWDRCESHRGRYSCAAAHDGRCLKSRGIGDCTCSSDELDAARVAIEPAPTAEEARDV